MYIKPYIIFNNVNSHNSNTSNFTLENITDNINTQLLILDKDNKESKESNLEIEEKACFIRQQKLEYWKSLLEIYNNNHNSSSNTPKLDKTIEDEIQNILNNKTLNEFVEFENEILETFNELDDTNDILYWTRVLDRIRYKKSFLIIDNMYNIFLDNNKEAFFEEQEEKANSTIVNTYNNTNTTNTTNNPHTIKLEEEDEEEEEEEEAGESNEIKLYKEKDEENKTDIYNIPKNNNKNSNTNNTYIKYYAPKYYNRIKRGYDWNKYYQLHFDYDNLPPKVIQGYKFIIYYYELKNTKQAPQYSIEPSDTPNTCILRFKAGPPYRDIAFSILNREWDMEEKHGFKNLFHRGTYYLYFNFKRYRYRR